MVWCLIGLLCVYAMFLIALSSIALAVLLALGPLFIASLFFDATRRFFSAWIAQLANYGLITILTVMIAALLLQVVESYAAQTAARGAAIVTVDALNMVLIAVLVFLIMRQVMPIAAGLAGGLALEYLRSGEPHSAAGFGDAGRGESPLGALASRYVRGSREVAMIAAAPRKRPRTIERADSVGTKEGHSCASVAVCLLLLRGMRVARRALRRTPAAHQCRRACAGEHTQIGRRTMPPLRSTP